MGHFGIISSCALNHHIPTEWLSCKSPAAVSMGTLLTALSQAERSLLGFFDQSGGDEGPCHITVRTRSTRRAQPPLQQQLVNEILVIRSLKQLNTGSAFSAEDSYLHS